MSKQQQAIGYGAVEVMQIMAQAYKIKGICEEIKAEIEYSDKKIKEIL